MGTLLSVVEMKSIMFTQVHDNFDTSALISHPAVVSKCIN